MKRMRKVSPGLVCIVLGVVLLLAAGGLYAYNRCEDAHAGAEAQTVVADLQQKVETPEPEAESGPLDPELPVVEIDGNEYVGEISIPAIGIDLPVMSEWSYPRLKIAPCRQFGSSRTDDLVIAAHNYESHFGKLTSLTSGDSVTFTDMDGIVNEYVVNKVEVLDPHSVEEVEHSGYALVLYTCTYGGKTRVTVFCGSKRNREIFLYVKPLRRSAPAPLVGEPLAKPETLRLYIVVCCCSPLPSNVISLPRAPLLGGLSP